MNTSGRIDDEGIYAFNPPPRSGGNGASDGGGDRGGDGGGGPPAAARTRRRGGAWRWWLAGLLCATLLLTALAVLLGLWVAYEALPQLASGWELVVDGVRVATAGTWPAEPSLGQVLLVVAAVTLAVLAAAFVLSVVVPLALGLGLLAAVMGVGVALLAVVLAAALVLAPLWIVLRLAWRALRRKPGAATMAA